MFRFRLSLWVLCPLLLAAQIPLSAQSAMALSSVRKIYIDKMDNNLDQYLTAAISRKFHGTVEVVLDKRQADAVLKGMNTAAQNTREGTVELIDRSGHTVLWSGSAGDRNMYMLNLKHSGEQQVADKLIGQLKKAMQP